MKIKTKPFLKTTGLFGLLLSFSILSSSGSCGGSESNTTKKGTLSNSVTESIQKLFDEANHSLGLGSQTDANRKYQSTF